VKSLKTEIGSGTILLVEDQEDVRNLAGQVLKQCGYHVLEAANGAEALAKEVEYQQPIHLFLTDIIMPGMTGREAAEQIRSRRPGIKVLFMSGYAEDVIVHQGILESSLLFIGKPFSPAELAAKVHELLHEKEPGSQG
jgi:two-component system, cell cycle sensor histidine kinase and response regulator CckA